MTMTGKVKGAESSGQTDTDWQVFRDEADETFRIEMIEEMRLRASVMPEMVIPFPSSVSHPEIVVEENVEVPMRDGCILRADVFRPISDEPFPVVINRGPYDKESSLDFTPAVARNLAKRGYVCICQDTRGRYQSKGVYEPFQNEIEDGVDTIEWAATQPWSTGRVGMFGISYNGLVQLQAAVGQANHLCCIYPGMIGYGVDFRRDGVLMLAAGGWHIWAGQGQESLNPERIDNRHLPSHEIDDKAGYPNPQFKALFCEDAVSRMYGPVAKKVFHEHLAKVETPAYVVAGWYDELLNDTLATWQELARNTSGAKLMIGPWHHNLCDMLEARIGLVPTEDVELSRYYEQMEMFFAQHLKGEDNVVSRSDAPIKLFVMGENVWRDEFEWPLARTQWRPIYAGSRGSADSSLEDGVLAWELPAEDQPADEFDYDPLNPVSWSSQSQVWTYLNEMGSRVDVENRSDVLVYSSPIFEEKIEITGSVKAVLFAASNCEDTDFVVNLVDVYPDGHTQYLTHGIVRARYRNGFDCPELLEPGSVERYEINLWPTSNVFQEGHRLRFEITSSDFDRYERNQNVATLPGLTMETRVAKQSVFHGIDYPTHFVLPVIPTTARTR